MKLKTNKISPNLTLKAFLNAKTKKLYRHRIKTYIDVNFNHLLAGKFRIMNMIHKVFTI